jgi:hypothetical protein
LTAAARILTPAWMRAGASRTLRRRQSLRDGTPRRLRQPAEVYLASSPTVPAAGCRVVAERIVRPLRRPEISRAPGAACCLGAAVRRGDTWLRLNRLASRIRNQRGKRIYFFASEDLLCMHITRPSTDFFQASMATYVRTSGALPWPRVAAESASCLRFLESSQPSPPPAPSPV